MSKTVAGHKGAVVKHLEEALSDADDPEVRYHIREALQLAEGM